jgi:hypothetical protein
MTPEGRDTEPGEPRPSGPYAGAYDPSQLADAPFMTGEIADRGPLERGSVPLPEPRARDARELERHREWRDSARQATQALDAEAGADAVMAGIDDDGSDEDELDDDELLAAAIEGDAGESLYDPLGGTAPDGYATSLPTIRVVGFGISRKRLEQAIRELQLPVVVVRDLEEADVVMTLRSAYRQKPPALREAEELAKPIYVLKSNTILQMQACLTSLYSVDVDPREAALRETEEAIGLVIRAAKPVELSPQNAYIRRLQHQMAERANLVSRSRGREPYRRVRLYPDQVRVWR